MDEVKLINTRTKNRLLFHNELYVLKERLHRETMFQAVIYEFAPSLAILKSIIPCVPIYSTFNFFHFSRICVVYVS